MRQFFFFFLPFSVLPKKSNPSLLNKASLAHPVELTDRENN